MVLFSATAFLRDCFPSPSISEGQNLAPYWSFMGFLPLSHGPVSNIHWSVPTHRAGKKPNPGLCLLATRNIPFPLSLAKASLTLISNWWAVWKHLFIPNIYGFFFPHVLFTLWLPAPNKTKGHFLLVFWGGYGFLPPKCSINKSKGRKTKQATVSL